MVEHWRTFSWVPAYYTFPLSLSPQPLIGLGKFMAGHIHQSGPRRATWPPTPPGSTPSSAPCAVMKRRRSATPSSDARPRPMPGYATSKALPRLPRTPPSSSHPPSSLPWPPILERLAPTSPRTCPPELPPSPASMVFPSSPPAPSPLRLFASSPPRPV